MRIGYQRAVDGDGTLQAQRIALTSAGCDLVYEDLGLSGIQSSRPGLTQLLNALQPGDVCVVWRLDRLARDFTDVLEVLTQVLVCGAGIVSIEDDLDSERLGSDQALHMLRAFLSHRGNIETERALAERRRRIEALRGPGRPSSVSDSQWVAAQALFNEGETSVAKVAGQIGVSRQALYRKRESGRV